MSDTGRRLEMPSRTPRAFASGCGIAYLPELEVHEFSADKAPPSDTYTRREVTTALSRMDPWRRASTTGPPNG